MSKFLSPFLLLLVLALSGCGPSMMPHRSSQKARVIIAVPNSLTMEQAKTALREAVASQASGFQENENFEPETLPDKPGQPTHQPAGNPMFAGNPYFESMGTKTEDSYYSIRGQRTIEGSFGSGSQDMAYVGALYLGKNESRIYVYLFFSASSDGLGDELDKALAGEMVGADGPIPFIVRIKEKILTTLPAASLVSASPDVITKLTVTGTNRITAKK